MPPLVGSYNYAEKALESITFSQGRQIAEQYGTPTRIYLEKALKDGIDSIKSVTAPFGLTARFAMKANPLRGILRMMNEHGIHIDASSQYEVRRAMRAGIPAHHIQLTAQEWPQEDGILRDLHEKGVLLNPCSLNQLTRFANLFPGADVGFRVNPGLGSGGTNRTNTGGVASSFGIWHENLGEVFDIVRGGNLKLTRLHSHIGSGSDVSIWTRCAELTLQVAAEMIRMQPEIADSLRVINLGGGYKVARVETEAHTDIYEAFERINGLLRAFAEQHRCRLHLEIEPGTYPLAHAGYLLARVQDLASTGSEGYRFLKLDTGMTELLRPSLYGAQHAMKLLIDSKARENERVGYVVVGHCCESGDIFTPKPGSPEELSERLLPRAEIGDLMLIGGAGAYAEGFSTVGYNSFPEPAAVMIEESGSIRLLKKRSDPAAYERDEL